MSKYFQAGWVLLYVLLTINCFLFMLVLSGVYISYTAGYLIMIMWVLFCYAGAWSGTGLYLFFGSRCRRPLREEEERLRVCLGEVLGRAGCKKEFRLLIDETPELNAFAAGHQTIVLSARALRELDDGELKGVMAHELGHLVSRDAIVRSAMVTASQLPFIVKYLCLHIRRMLVKAIRLSWVIAVGISFLMGVLGLIGLYIFMQKYWLLLPVLSWMFFVLLFGILDRVFPFFSRILSRFSEYRQDAYACRLGFGAGLTGALKKMAAAGEPPVSRFQHLLSSTHPMLYNRIRRLEDLLAQEANDL